MQILAAAQEQELQERVSYAREVLEAFDRKVNDPEVPQSPLMHFLDGLLKVLHPHQPELLLPIALQYCRTCF